MFDDDIDFQKPEPGLKNLEPLSIEELENYIQELESEIERARLDIEKKKKSEEAALAVFKS